MTQPTTRLQEDVHSAIPMLVLRVLMPLSRMILNSFMCSSLNRTGLLCSQCRKGLGPAVLSYKWQCVECFDKRYG